MSVCVDLASTQRITQALLRGDLSICGDFATGKRTAGSGWSRQYETPKRILRETRCNLAPRWTPTTKTPDRSAQRKPQALRPSFLITVLHVATRQIYFIIDQVMISGVNFLPARLCTLAVSSLNDVRGGWTTGAFSSRHRTQKYLTLNDAGVCPDGHNDDASGCRLRWRLYSCLSCHCWLCAPIYTSVGLSMR
jgi:hypothetical protein